MDVSRLKTGDEVIVEYKGQIVKPASVLRRFGPFIRVLIPVKDGYYRLVWIPRWRVFPID